MVYVIHALLSGAVGVIWERYKRPFWLGLLLSLLVSPLIGLIAILVIGRKKETDNE